MRILGACSLGGAGHLQPLLPFLDAAHRGGHQTLVVAPPALRGMAELTGHPFAPGGEPPEAEVAPIRERLPVAPPGEAAILGNRDLFARRAATAMLPGLERLCAHWSPDLVLRDPCEYASAIVATKEEIPHAQVAISLAQVEDDSIAVAAPALEERLPGLPDAIRAAPYLSRLPPSLDPSVFPRTMRFREPRSAGSQPEWWATARRPRVYISFGTVLGYMSIAGAVFDAVLKAVAGLDVCGLLTVGQAFDPAALGRIPEHVRVQPWVDQASVIGDADVVVCHGGSGTAFGALAAGVPLVIVPVFADQFENGRRIADVGAGVTIDDGLTATGGRRVIGEDASPRIAAAIDEVLAVPAYRQAAATVAAEVASSPTVDTVLDELLAAAIAAQ